MKNISLMFFKSLLLCSLLCFTSCTDEFSSLAITSGIFLGEGFNITECDSDHPLSTGQSNLVLFGILVRDRALKPISNLEVNVVFRTFYCNGKSNTHFVESFTTDSSGGISGEVDMPFLWSNDAGEWQVSISSLDFNYAGHIERFDIGTTSLSTIITIANLED